MVEGHPWLMREQGKEEVEERKAEHEQGQTDGCLL